VSQTQIVRALGHRAAAARVPSGPGPIYIAGLDRSGKTTMAAFLTSHTHIAIPPVGSNMETYFLGRWGDLSDDGNLDRCLAAMQRYTHIRDLGVTPEQTRRRFVEGERTYARLFGLVLIAYAERQGKRRWGAQTGLVEGHADHLFASYEGVRVIHMVRDPRDRYVASREAWPGGKGGVGAATARWQHSTRLAERNERRYAGSYLVVRYEDLVSRTEQTLREVCAFVGEPYQHQMLEMSGAPERRRRLGSRSMTEPGGSPPGGSPLSTRFVGTFRGAMAPTELAFMQLHGRRGMRRRGYVAEPTGLSPIGWASFAVSTWPPQMARLVAWRVRERLHLSFPARFGRSPDPRTIVDIAEPSGDA
jgi:hypothetical protein